MTKELKELLVVEIPVAVQKMTSLNDLLYFGGGL